MAFSFHWIRILFRTKSRQPLANWSRHLDRRTWFSDLNARSSWNLIKQSYDHKLVCVCDNAPIFCFHFLKRERKTIRIMFNLKEKACIVTGASKGIGLGLVQALLRHGAYCLMLDVDYKVFSLKHLLSKSFGLLLFTLF